MAFLTIEELTSTYYPKAATMDSGDINIYLMRANAYAKGEIGGEPPIIDEGVKAAVALAFEIFSVGESAQVDEDTGNITEAAPGGYYATDYSRKSRYTSSDRMATVKEMLRPYKLAFEAANAAKSDRGVSFI